MSGLAKKHRTNSVRVIVEGEKKQEFQVGKAMLGRVLKFLRAASASVPSEEVFADLHAKYTEPGAMLQGARLKAGLSQEELAEKLGIDQGNLSKLEHGKRPIGKAMAKRLAEVLDTDYRVFL